MRNNYPDDLKAHKPQLEQAKKEQCKTSEQAKWEWVKRELAYGSLSVCVCVKHPTNS